LYLLKLDMTLTNWTMHNKTIPVKRTVL